MLAPALADGLECRAMDPIVVARLLNVPAAEYAARLGVSPAWARALARNPKNSRRVLLAVIEAAAERLRVEVALR